MTTAVPLHYSLPKRALRSVQYWLARVTTSDGYVAARAAPFDLTFRGPAADCITRHIFRLGAHEPHVTRYVLEHVRLRPGDVALDIGANLGWYSVLLDRLSLPGAQIFAFEPDPESFRLLQENLQLNRASQVTALNMALGDNPGFAELRRYNSKNNGCHTLFAGGNCEGGIAQVSIETLGHVWEQQQLGSRPLRFMKIDVEGYEYFALRGAGELLRRCGCLVMEYTPDALQLAGQRPSAMVDCFAEAGLQAQCFVNGELQLISLEELAATRTQRDLVLTPAPMHNAGRS